MVPLYTANRLVSVGRTPFQNVVATGQHSISIRRAGYETIERTVEVGLGEEIVLREELERVTFGRIRLVANVRNARVLVDGTEVGNIPYEGEVDPAEAADVSARLLGMGAYEISLGDTIGVGTPGQVSGVVEACAQDTGIERLAVHLHDTYGQALANIYAALLSGVAVVDSSVAGLGGCPYAPGAAGNVATEDVVYMLHDMGISTGIDLDKLVVAGERISEFLGRRNGSSVARALINKRQF